MASSHDTNSLIDRVYAAASHLHHLNRPVPHFLLDVHDAMIPHIEKLQSSLQDRGWDPVALPPFLSTLEARLAVTGLVVGLGIFLLAAALPRVGGSKREEDEVKIEEKEVHVSVVQKVVGEAGIEKQEVRSEVEVTVEEEREEDQNDSLETQPVPASVSIAAVVDETPAAPATTPASPPPSELPSTTTATPASPVAAPVSKKGTRNSVDPRSPRPEVSTNGGHRTSPIRTRSSTSSIPVRVPTTPARASSYPAALNTAIANSKNATPVRKITSPATSPASAKVLAASYAWVMSEGLEWNDGGSETEERSYNSGSHSDEEEDDKSSPRSRRSLEDELAAAGYKGELGGDNDNDDSASEDDAHDEHEHEHDGSITAAAAAVDDVEKNGALHPRRHSHTSDIEARYEEWRKTRAAAQNQHGHGPNHAQKSMTAPVGGLVGGVRKTRSHHSRKDSVLDGSPGTGRSSFSMMTPKSVGSVTRQALQGKRSSTLKPWARKRKDDFGEWLKKKTTTTTNLNMNATPTKQ